MIDTPHLTDSAEQIAAVIHLDIPRTEMKQAFAPAADLWEWYVVGPHRSPNPADWRTELNRPLIG